MQQLFRNPLPGLALAALSLLVLAGCPDRKEAATSQGKVAVDVSKTVEIAKQNIPKIRLTMAASRETRIEILGAEPSLIPGLVDLKMRVTREGRKAIRKVTVTPDLKYVIRGLVLPLGKIPRMRVEMENVALKGFPTRGNPDAPVTIVEYADFQCVFCRAVEPQVDRLLRDYKGKVKLVFKHFPVPAHAWAFDAALLSECARRQKPEAFWKLHDYYFANSGKISQENVLEMTQKALEGEGIKMDVFNKCYVDRDPEKQVLADVDEGKVIGVRGTPAFLFNDVFVSGMLPYEVLDAVVREELGEDWLGKDSPA
jgi:protein-disulfide isomerase